MLGYENIDKIKTLKISKRLKKRIKNGYKYMFICPRLYNSYGNTIKNFHNVMKNIKIPKEIALKILQFLSVCSYLDEAGLKNLLAVDRYVMDFRLITKIYVKNVINP